jgi:hypothetical protein
MVLTLDLIVVPMSFCSLMLLIRNKTLVELVLPKVLNGQLRIVNLVGMLKESIHQVAMELTLME